MLLSRVVPFLIHAPKSPDFFQCDPIYGRNIDPFDCRLVIELHWPAGNTPVYYYFEDPSPSNGIKIPKYDRQGSCNVAIEPAGPRYGKANGFPSYLKHRPDRLRGLAEYVIEMCVRQGGGIGGFVTVGIDAAERYVGGVINEDWEQIKDWESGVHNNGAFLTISMNGVDRTAFMPGDTDPWVPGYLSMYAARLSQLFHEKMEVYKWISLICHWLAESMERGGHLRWTSMPSMSIVREQIQRDNTLNPQPELDPDIEGHLMGLPEKMTYQCDSSLGGGPDPVDCEKLSWSGLKTPDSVETLEAGVPKFYSEGKSAFLSHHDPMVRFERKKERKIRA